VAHAVLRPIASALEAWPTDAWAELEPRQAGMDGTGLRLADEQIRAAMPDVTGIVVVRQNALVFERYYNGYGPDDPIKVRSVTKSVVSALVGIALDEGELDGLDQTLGELIPDRFPPGADPGTADVTLENLLTMTSGLEWDLGSDYQRLIASDNWVDLTLGLPLAAEPGTTYVYNSGGSHLLSVIVGEATGDDTADYAQARLFDPIGIPKPRWGRSPQGETIGGFGLELTPRDMAKIGYLYLNEGRWDDEQLIPADYVRASTIQQSDGDATGAAAYGYQWWISTAAGYPSYFALGYGGQYIYVVPDLDLVVVVAAGWDDDPPEFLRTPRPLIEEVIAPAVIEP